jgi:hypothetical protein
MAKNINAEHRACRTLELRMTDEETACWSSSQTKQVFWRQPNSND